MFTPVIRIKMNPNWARAVNLLRVGAALVVLLGTAQVLAAPEPGSANGESWDATPSAAPATGTVAMAPASAPGVTTVTRPTAPTPPTQAAPVQLPTQPTADEAADAAPEALTMFSAQLDPYGGWVDDARYGRVWVPNRAVVGENFSPYVTGGHWALDGEDNWIWVSDYPFGWVVFHYGRWFYSAEYGWAWVPGRTYAPNWVVWRLPNSTYSYVGWAPMPPRYGWFAGGPVWYSSYGAVSYVFCPSDYVFYPSVGLYLVHDPWMVSRLGIYTSFYYPPYYYGGYYGYGYGYGRGYGRGYYRGGGGHAGYRPPAYGPPINRTRISARAMPRERIAADPRAVAAAPRTTSGATSGFGGLQRSPVSGSSGFGASRTRASPVSPGVSRSTPFAPSVTTAPRRMPSTVAPSVPRTSVPRSFSPAPMHTPSVRSNVTTFRSPSPSFRSPSPSFRSPSPSFHSPSPSFSAPRSSGFGGGGGGRRHR